MHIRFYRINTNISKNVVHKLSLLPDKYIYLDGQLRNETDIMNVNLLVDISPDSNIEAQTSDGDAEEMISDFRNDAIHYANYVYIPLLRRYYFIKRIELTRMNLLTFYLHEDVLMHTTFIDRQTAFVSRNENTYNKELPDERRIVTNKTTVSVYKPHAVTTGSKVNTTININQPSNSYCAVVNCLYGDNNATTVKTNLEYYAQKTVNVGQLDTNDNLPYQIANGFVLNICNSEIVTLKGLGDTLATIFNSSPTASYVNNIFVYPFEINDYDSLNIAFAIHGADVKDSNNNFVIARNGLYYSSRKIIADFVLDETINDFNDLEPYSNYEIYLPFYGWTKLAYNQLRNKRIIVYYTICLATGTATVNVYNFTDKYLVFTSSCNLGVEVPKNTSNYQQVIDRQFANNLNLGIGVGTGLLTGVIGSKTGSIKTEVAGLTGVARSLGSYAINERTNYNMAQIENGSDADSLFQPTEVFIRKITSTVHYSLNSSFLAHNGGVLNSLRLLSSLSGYTEILEIPNINFKSIGYFPFDDEIEEIITLLKNGVIL